MTFDTIVVIGSLIPMEDSEAVLPERIWSRALPINKLYTSSGNLIVR